jgi:hypothetical protein
MYRMASSMIWFAFVCLVGADGRGFPPGARPQTCSTCGGRGRVRIFCCETCTFSEQTPGTNYSSTLRCCINEQKLMVYLPIRQPGQSPCVVYRSSIGLSWRIWSMFKTSLLCLSRLGFLCEAMGQWFKSAVGFMLWQVVMRKAFLKQESTCPSCGGRGQTAQVPWLSFATQWFPYSAAKFLFSWN